ncbi:TPA: RHS repeat-associated core domain-containing protein, partial [Enterobacter cloacae]
ARSAVEADYKTVRYSGKERDATGLYHYGYRYYQPWSGRWLSADPAGTVDGLNLFRMCRNNPVTLKDENGLAPTHGGGPFSAPHTNHIAAAHTRGWLSRLFMRRRELPSQETNSSVIGVGSVGIVRTFKDGWLIKEFSGYFDMQNKMRLHSAINNAKGFNLFYGPGSAFVRIEGMDGTEAKKVRNIMRSVPGVSLNKLTDMPAVLAAVSVIDQENPSVYLSEKLSRLGITHNDINLGNIMYDEIRNEFNLVDFDSASFSKDKEGNVKSLTDLQKESMKKKLDYVFNDFKRKVRQMKMLSKQ